MLTILKTKVKQEIPDCVEINLRGVAASRRCSGGASPSDWARRGPATRHGEQALSKLCAYDDDSGEPVPNRSREKSPALIRECLGSSATAIL
jgi:hypothetical protein